jgi:putative Holliday junction resolvase
MPDNGQRPTGTLLAFDFGHRRIGVAVGQTLTGTATALAVVPVSGEPDWVAIERVIRQWKPVALVVGLPLDEAGGETDMSGDARGFGRQLEKRHGLSVMYTDERLTSRAAEERFIEGRVQGAMRRKDAALKDAIAAQIILDHQYRGPSIEPGTHSPSARH